MVYFQRLCYWGYLAIGSWVDWIHSNWTLEFLRKKTRVYISGCPCSDHQDHQMQLTPSTTFHLCILTFSTPENTNIFSIFEATKKTHQILGPISGRDANIQGALCDTKNRSNPRPTVVRIVGGLMFRATNLDELQVIKADGGEICFLLLMEEIRRPPLEVGSLSLYYLHGFIHRRWLTGFLPSTVSPGLNVWKKTWKGLYHQCLLLFAKGVCCFLLFWWLEHMLGCSLHGVGRSTLLHCRVCLKKRLKVGYLTNVSNDSMTWEQRTW